MMRSTASTISVNNRRSRRIQRRRQLVDLISQQGVDRLFRHEIDVTAEQPSEFVFEIVDSETESSTRGEDVDQVDVTVGAGIATSDRTEHRQFCDPVALADLSHTRRINRVPVNSDRRSVAHRTILAFPTSGSRPAPTTRVHRPNKHGLRSPHRQGGVPLSPR